MRLCPTCDAEYRNGRDRCLDDDTPLLEREAWEAELARQGRRPFDFRSLVSVVSVANRFEAEVLARALADQGLHPGVVASRAELTGGLDESGPIPFLVVVPESEVERAGPAVTELRAELESAGAEAAAAAAAEAEATAAVSENGNGPAGSAPDRPA